MNVGLGTADRSSTNPKIAMKLLLAAVFCSALFVAVDGKHFNFKKCIRLDVNGTVTVTYTKANKTEQKVINLSTGKGPTGDCSKPSSVKMLVPFDNMTSWELDFTNDKGQVNLVQSVTFDPAAMFNLTSMNDSVTVSTDKPLPLSSSNASYLCESEQTIPFASKEEGNYTFTVSQDITSIQVQAFSLPNGTFSPAEHCASDLTTVAPTTAPLTTPPVPSVKPVKSQMFVVTNGKGTVCFRMQAGLQFAVEYETIHKTMAFSKVMVIPGSANVTGTCANNSATMIITDADYSLSITETRSKDKAQSAIKLTVKLDPANFPNATQGLVNKTVSFDKTRSLEQSSMNTFYVCDSLQEITFDNSSTTLYTNDVQLQAFGLANNGSFTGNGVHCGMDPTPQPMPPASVPGDNTYTVQDGNITCIVLKGEISFSNVTYATNTGGHAVALPINIPELNETSKNVKYSGNCSLEKGNAQRLAIIFNKNWTLTLTFARGSAKDSSMLGATANEFSLRDIEFVYSLEPKFFPNASTPHVVVTASQTNITSDFMKGSVNGGSYKCDAEQTEKLNTGIEFQTTDLQYKAFNNDNTTAFGNNVSECSADDESNSIVPIAVGAALAGLVAIVLIAYLIGRRRSRRQGYESV